MEWPAEETQFLKKAAEGISKCESDLYVVI